MNIASVYERNQDCTLHISNLDNKVDEEILYELFIQCGPVVSLHLPKDKVTKTHQGFAFLEFRNESDCNYAIKIMNLIKVYGKPIKLSKASTDKRITNIGANIFVGNLSKDIDDKILRNIFSNFGTVVNLRLIEDKTKTKQHALIDYSSFESSDNAIKSMNEQMLYGKKLVVEYALKPNSSTEKYGSLAERLLSSNNK